MSLFYALYSFLPRRYANHDADNEHEANDDEKYCGDNCIADASAFFSEPLPTNKIDFVHSTKIRMVHRKAMSVKSILLKYHHRIPADDTSIVKN